MFQTTGLVGVRRVCSNSHSRRHNIDINWRSETLGKKNDTKEDSLHRIEVDENRISGGLQAH